MRCSKPFLLSREEGKYQQKNRTAHNIIKRRKTHFYLCQTSMCVDFLKIGRRLAKQHRSTFSYEVSFYMYKSERGVKSKGEDVSNKECLQKK